jgi:CRISPR/Cas system-associated exonuclease Cas4 (RecB family)
LVEWKLQLEAFYSLLNEIRQTSQGQTGKLRFNRQFVIASDIADQFYCEKKVELTYLHGEVETEAKNNGTEAHENLTADSQKVKREKLWCSIYGNKPIFALEMFLLIKHGDVLLAGRPDSVLFHRGFPLVLFEYKFSRSGVAYPSYHVQAQIYGLLLKGMGFDTTRLSYAIVVADPSTRGSRELRKEVIHAVIENGPKEAVLIVKDARIYVSKFDLAAAEKTLSWALEFWKNSRRAQIANNPNKCRKCEYQSYCKID